MALPPHTPNPPSGLGLGWKMAGAKRVVVTRWSWPTSVMSVSQAASPLLDSPAPARFRMWATCLVVLWNVDCWV
jgi:hypothetical protein